MVSLGKNVDSAVASLETAWLAEYSSGKGTCLASASEGCPAALRSWPVAPSICDPASSYDIA